MIDMPFCGRRMSKIRDDEMITGRIDKKAVDTKKQGVQMIRNGDQNVAL